LSESLYKYYEKQLGFWVVRVEGAIIVSALPAWRPKVLEVKRDALRGYGQRRSWDQLGEQAQYSRTWFDPAVPPYVSRWR
jgi:GntR family transcriptional regulator